MDNNGSPNQYPNPYFYPPNPYQPYPPPPTGIPVPNPYEHVPYPYPYNPSHSFNYSYPPPPRSSLSYSGSGHIDYPCPPHPQSPSSCAPLDFNQPPPKTSYPATAPSAPTNPYPAYPYHVPPGSQSPSRASHSHTSSLPYGSSQYYYPQNEAYLSPQQSDAHSRTNSFAGPYYVENTSSTGGGSGTPQPSDDSKPSPSAITYPPLDDLMSNVRLSDSTPSDIVSSPQQPVRPLMHSISTSKIEQKKDDFYGHANNSFSGWGNSYSSRVDSSKLSSSSFGSFNESVQIVPVQNKGSLRVLLLHGNLDIWVLEAKNLPNMDMFHKTLGDMFGKLPGTMGNKIEGTMNKVITSDPYVTISVANAVIGRTFVISNSENPVWMQHFYVPVAHHAAEVHFVVKDSDVVGSQLIGIVAIPVEQIYSGELVEGTYPILNSSGKPCKPGAVLRLSIQYIPMAQLSIYHQGVGAGPEYIGVPATYFPLRKGGTVTLYQDAHVPDGCLPNVFLDNGKTYVNGKCWYDIYDAIRQARRLIYITGWSVWHKVTLIRDGAVKASDYALGDLLRSKSQEGVRVLLLVWDDPTSRSILGYKTDGVMATHDEETRRFFKNSSVHVLLCPRSAGKRHSWYKQKEVGTIYTHHQKTVIVDADAGNNMRKIIAFVGGLDLCDGRYDTPDHHILRTLHTLHKDDYHNPTFTGNVGGCPREPWHDLHSKIDGPAAYDVLKNFEERWLRASKPHGIKKLKKYDDALLKLERIPDIIRMTDLPCIGHDDPESWHVQIFRSIDSNSVKGFPKDPKEASSKNLVCGKNVLIDMSIHTAYVKAIRAAQHYIYIENQYFIGSSYNWSQHKDLGANNLIPLEIALKIAEKIKAHERFAVYIVIPMWPEGVPTGAATQRILYWQNNTMQMMYDTVYKALVDAGVEAAFSPQDYLNFFCLGNRESTSMYDNVTVSGAPPQANSVQANSRNSRRFMIYVHSKGMIVDDEYVILGSANINQRSMEGTRDSEIAMGAYQPHYTWARKSTYPLGQVHGYRMSLWAEHTGTIEDCFLQPESLECVRRVKAMGEMNWRQYAANEVTEMRGHLMKYPVDVDRKGKVRPLPGHEEFPDVGGKIVGSFLAMKENLTI
ncbi:phospholipase D beta 2 [Arachis duranensis]|uniref:Phospholipase D alpha 1 n=1 Tax=Arachis duranensis TaxID=130453 RepID=A0A6P4D307_ARADU|nr:phospholipase D beta 2 [Arachis duranensis]